MSGPKRSRKKRSLVTGIDTKTLNIPSILGLGLEGVVVKFEDLPEDTQQDLLEKLPEHVLRSNQCVIKKTALGISVFLNNGDLFE